ncbi:MAG TPA: GDL motif peptide-associated radical SAM/SPASM maturase [Pyrinomonadaceae bacterium]|nr:GDL motif peptide-associated radical SAM/SPASM maturase [Pyrinomonadaceae bacterium]
MLTNVVAEEPRRFLSDDDRDSIRPVHVVWEITLACDLKCQHCGSRAGKRRTGELSTAECFDLIRQMARLGTREVTIIGGEVYMRRDWTELIREIRAQGMDCTMQTGGLHLTEERIREAAAAGLQAGGVSIDGLPELHDRLRGVKGSFDAGLNALRLMREYGLTTSVNTQITAEVIPQLRELMNLFIEAGAKNWQIQLTVAMGRAADHPELLLQPYDLLVLMPLIAELYRESIGRGFLIQPGNNIGYFGPHESVWRGSGDDRVHWSSCNAGENTMGIEADGTIKGCPSLPTDAYAGGNIRDLTLEDIWLKTPELSFTRTRTVEDLWGFCRTCYYADVCRAGCTWTTHVLFGRPGNNPYCHHRALELEERGLRERIEQVEAAPGKPFDHGRFELVLEPSDGGPRVRVEAPSEKEEGLAAQRKVTPVISQPLVQIKSTGKRSAQKVSDQAHTLPPPLVVCRGCKRYVKPEATVCPHCGGDMTSLALGYKKKVRNARKAMRDLLKHLPA